MRLKNFEIDSVFLTSVAVVKEYNHNDRYVGKDKLTDDEVVDAITHATSTTTMTSHIDHPVFTALRKKLGRDGYINIELGWWNGDRVLKPFKLNGMPFKQGDQFSCAPALGISMRIYEKEKNRANSA